MHSIFGANPAHPPTLPPKMASAFKRRELPLKNSRVRSGVLNAKGKQTEKSWHDASIQGVLVTVPGTEDDGDHQANVIHPYLTIFESIEKAAHNADEQCVNAMMRMKNETKEPFLCLSNQPLCPSLADIT